jgi:Kef-type K+ transport system membrane component KefB
MQTAGKFAIVALIALAFTALPGGSGALDVLLALLTIVIFTAIALLGYRLYRQYRFELDSLSERQRLVLYSSIGLAFLTFCATARMFDAGGAGAVAWIALLGICSYGLYWVWTQYRSYG